MGEYVGYIMKTNAKIFLALFSCIPLLCFAQEEESSDSSSDNEESEETISQSEETPGELIIPIPLTQHYIIHGPWPRSETYNINFDEVRQHGYFYDPPRTPYGQGS